jgi:hypothetical protein
MTRAFQRSCCLSQADICVLRTHTHTHTQVQSPEPTSDKWASTQPQESYIAAHDRQRRPTIEAKEAYYSPPHDSASHGRSTTLHTGASAGRTNSGHTNCDSLSGAIESGGPEQEREREREREREQHTHTHTHTEQDTHTYTRSEHELDQAIASKALLSSHSLADLREQGLEDVVSSPVISKCMGAESEHEEVGEHEDMVHPETEREKERALIRNNTPMGTRHGSRHGEFQDASDKTHRSGTLSQKVLFIVPF